MIFSADSPIKIPSTNDSSPASAELNSALAPPRIIIGVSSH